MKPTSSMLFLAPLAGTVLAFGAAVLVTRSAEARGGAPAFWDDQQVEFVRQKVAADYVDEVSDKTSRDLFYSALDGYLKGLPDEYNDYYSPDEYRRWRDDTAGHYAGVGIRIEADPRGLKVVGVYESGPAARGGLRFGEIVTDVEGRSLANPDLKRPETLRALKGEPGSVVHVRIWSPPPMASVPKDAPKPAAPSEPATSAGGGDAPGSAPAPTAAAATAPGTTRELSLVRDVIRPATVFQRRLGKDGKVGYVRISEFTEQTADDFDRALDGLLAAGATSIVVDLRDNGGGVLPSTVRAADRFIREGPIVRMQGRAPNSTRNEYARVEDTIPDDVGLVVLVDGHTASASEVFAGCIQDYRRGVILGSRTYGKFLVQNITELPGKGAAMKLTTARYQTPLGRSYQRPAKQPEGAPAGLLPDIAVETSAADAEKIRFQRENTEEAIWGAPPKNADVKDDWVDPVLQRALDLIDGNLLMEKIKSATPRHG